MKRKAILATMLVFLMTAPCWAQAAGPTGFKDGKEARAFCETVLNQLVKGQVKEAFAVIGPQWLFPAAELQKVREQSEQNLGLVKERYGQIIDWKLVKEEEVAEVGLRLTYVVKYERHLIRWQFLFYKPRERWLLNTFKWDDALDALFGQ